MLSGISGVSYSFTIAGTRKQDQTRLKQDFEQRNSPPPPLEKYLKKRNKTKQDQTRLEQDLDTPRWSSKARQGELLEIRIKMTVNVNEKNVLNQTDHHCLLRRGQHLDLPRPGRARRLARRIKPTERAGVAR